MKRPDFRVELISADLTYCYTFSFRSCSEAPSLTNALWKGLITVWSWSDTLFHTNPSWKAQSDVITLQESVKNIGQDLITFLQTKAPVGKVRLQIGAVLKHAPLQILWEEPRKGLITDWSCTEAFSFTNPLRKGQITEWSCSEAFSGTNPQRKG